MNEPSISCPHCKTEVRLTETLTAPLIRATRKKIAEKETEIARRESAIRAQRAELARAVESIEQQFTTRLKTERERIAAEEARRHNFCRRQILKVSHRKLLTYSGGFKSATAN